jgi:hypothetical protein
LNVLEFLHQPDQVLAKCRQAANTLVLSYDLAGHGKKQARLERGYFNDFSEAELERLLKKAGWRADMKGRSGDGLMLRCIAE